jgi:hypothetical protein
MSPTGALRPARRDPRPGGAPGGLAGGPRPAASRAPRRDGSPGATLGDVHRSEPGGARGTARGTARRVVPARPVLSVRFSVASVQPARSVDGDVLMVRRRPTVRFRNGAPGHEKISNELNGRRGTSRKRRASAPMAAKPPMAQPEPARQLLTAAAGRPSRDSPVTARRGHARQAVQRPGSFRPDEPHHHPASDWRLLVSSGPAGQWSVNEGPDHGCEHRMGK